MDKLSIIVDNRERNYELLDQLSQYNIKLSFKQLPVGDYIISDRMCVERKTVNDFENSIIDSRIFDQAERLSKSFSKPILILEGNIDDAKLGRNVILGTILSLYREYNILIINSYSPEETSYLLSRFVEKEQNEQKREPKLSGIKKNRSELELQIMILSSIPGIGTKTARNMLSYFKNIKNIVDATPKELMKIEKIGKKKAEKINSLLNKPFNEII
ncbi:MAG: ERCC4 domain-containing protein [Candidatus Micrarchaeaceae archaeon]